MIKFESEHHFEMFLYNHFQETSICLIDDCEYSDCIRQFDTKSYGIPDLVFFDEHTEKLPHGDITHCTLHVVELKNNQITMSDIAQLCRYKTYFRNALKGKDIEMSFSLVVPEGVGKSGDTCFLINELNGIDVYEFKLDPRKGISFDLGNNWQNNDNDTSAANELFVNPKAIKCSEF